jgi:threonine/homoserine/homoserine lactone efflux protein
MLRLSQLTPVPAGGIAAVGATNGGVLEPLLAGLVAGFGVAIPLGAIGVMIVDLGMRGGFRPAAAAAAGVATADLLYAAVAAAAGAAAAAALAPHAHALRLISAAVLAVLGAYGLVAARRAAAIRAAHPPASAAPAARPAAPPAGPRIYARFLALTSINPLTVAYFAALIAGLPAVSSSSTGAKVAFVLAAGAASLSWQLVLAGAGAVLHHRLPPSARLYTALAGNAIVLALAVRMAVAA